MKCTFKEPALSALYDDLRSKRLDPAKVRGMSGAGNAYAVGYSQPDAASRLWAPGSRAYVAWAAGVDNAKQDRKQRP